MNVLRTAAFVFLALAATLVPSASYGAVSVDIGLFYDDLAPHGEWIQMESYGWVWTPRHVAADWRPYSRGHWALSDEDGWLWVSDEEWGWATCHYGRWFFDRAYGWVWVPGREWAPAWVSWRTGGGYIGWAPLTPQFGWNASVGLRVGQVDLDAAIGPANYVFVPEGHFLEPAVYRQALPVARNVTIVNATQNVTNYAVVHNRPVNRGVDVRQVEQTVHHAVPRVRVLDEASRQPRGRVAPGASEVAVFRPEVRDAPQKTPPRPKAQASAARPVVKAHPVDPSSLPKAPRPPEPQARASQKPQLQQPTTLAQKQQQERSALAQEQKQRRERDRVQAQNDREAREAKAKEDTLKKQQAVAREQQKAEQRQRQQQDRAAQAQLKQKQERDKAEAQQRQEAQRTKAREAQESLKMQHAQAREQQNAEQRQRQQQERVAQAEQKQRQERESAEARKARQAQQAKAKKRQNEPPRHAQNQTNNEDHP